ncbi:MULTISPECIES: peptidylprolyl isomerase [unclassified Bacteroides]|uniref:foldase protein PrsA n=1 Tax=unclassified Bacteroides TaxID=2646097 RepID=UPI000E9D6A73|nr:MULTISPECIES: peptidylprolyl isomerase [unclassified Bacteroides]RGN46021.1 hypothetical protein DXB63_11505 [Bacteroides sp. OM05-12]RHR74009.1 hypothetical protein DWW69_13345 [Bacteroides sp. AF16-49]
MMKKNLLFFAALALNVSAFAQQQDPVLMRINNKDVTRSEFEYIYNKNNSNNELDKKTLDEYVDLFVNFKLKVAAAEEAGLDTTKAFNNEFNGYRQQLAKSYLTDASVDEANALATYNRLKENVEASHLLIRLQPNATPEQVTDAYNKAERARQRIINGEPFDKVAREVSEDPSVAQNGGYLGYFTALQMIRPFEDVAYSLKVGEISEPIRTDFGFHVIKVTGRRPDIGKVLVAHIFKFLPQDASKEKEQQVEQQMDSIYNALQNGADFAELAKTLSEDKGTAARGGELPWVGLHQTVKEFEDIAFNLKKDEISKPFHSPNGMHIVKLIDRKQIEPFEEKKEEIMRRLTRMGEGNKGVEALIARLKKEYNFSIDENGVTSAKETLARLAEMKKDSTLTGTPVAMGNLFVLDGKAYSAQDFVEWAKNNNDAVDKLVDKYIDKEVLAYEDSKLEKKYPDFGHLMQEYRDGILLFEISNRQVWDKASKDEEGLDKFFKQNKSNYAWDAPRFRGIILHSSDESVLKEAKKLTKKNPEDEWSNVIRKAFNNDSVTVVKITKGLYAKGDNKYVDKLVFKSGSFEPMKDYPYTATYGKLLKKGPETYKDVRGPVTADYQNYLETAWIKELRDKYSVEIDQEVLKTVNNH